MFKPLSSLGCQITLSTKTLLISNKLTNQNTFGNSENLFLPKVEDQVKVDEVLYGKNFPVIPAEMHSKA